MIRRRDPFFLYARTGKRRNSIACCQAGSRRLKMQSRPVPGAA